MIYAAPTPDESIDQGDLIDGCPLVGVTTMVVGNPQSTRVEVSYGRGVILTQTCDLANQKAEFAVVAPVLDAQSLVDRGFFKPADIKGNVRSCWVWGWYFLPADATLELPEMLIDLRRLHTIRLDLPGDLCRTGNRRSRIKPLYREHLAKHFADTYSRIGLPRPYETMWRPHGPPLP